MKELNDEEIQNVATMAVLAIRMQYHVTNLTLGNVEYDVELCGDDIEDRLREIVVNQSLISNAILNLIEDPEAVSKLSHLWKQVREIRDMLETKYEPAISAVYTALIEKKSLTGEDVHSIAWEADHNISGDGNPFSLRSMLPETAPEYLTVNDYIAQFHGEEASSLN